MNHNKMFNLGKAIITPTDDVIAGSQGTWTLTLTIGTHGIDDGGHIRVAWRVSGDWKYPQFNDPQKANYATITTSGKAKLDLKFDQAVLRALREHLDIAAPFLVDRCHPAEVGCRRADPLGSIDERPGREPIVVPEQRNLRGAILVLLVTPGDIRVVG